MRKLELGLMRTRLSSVVSPYSRSFWLGRKHEARVNYIGLVKYMKFYDKKSPDEERKCWATEVQNGEASTN
jgi:hypothetical protein